MRPPSPDGRVAFQSRKHPARSHPASLPRLERAPSGEMASWRLIIDRSTIDNPSPSSIDRSSMFNHRSTIAVETRSSSFIDDVPSPSSDRPSTIDQQSSILVGHRSTIDVIAIFQRSSDEYRHRSIDRWSYIKIRLSSFAINHRLAIIDQLHRRPSSIDDGINTIGRLTTDRRSPIL